MKSRPKQTLGERSTKEETTKQKEPHVKTLLQIFMGGLFLGLGVGLFVGAVGLPMWFGI